MHANVDGSLSPKEFSTLKRVLSQANEVCRLLSDHSRLTRARNYARHRARRLGLCVDIEKAKACPQKAVSVIPLPIIDTDPSPTAASLALLQAEHRRLIRHKRNWTLPTTLTDIVPALGSETRKDGTHTLSPLNLSLSVQNFSAHGKPTTSVLWSGISVSQHDTSPALRLSAMSLQDSAPANRRRPFLPLPDVLIESWNENGDTPSSSGSSASLVTPVDSYSGSILRRTSKRKAAENEDVFANAEEIVPKEPLLWFLCQDGWVFPPTRFIYGLNRSRPAPILTSPTISSGAAPCMTYVP